jgi:hypothetical protein
MKPRILAAIPLLLGVLFIAGSPPVQAEKPKCPPTPQPPAAVAVAPGYAPTWQAPAGVAVPAYAPTWQAPAPAAVADQEVIKELLDILNTTESEDTFLVVVMTLTEMKPRDRHIIPRVIRAAERVGVMKGMVRAVREGEKEAEVKNPVTAGMMELFEVIVNGPEASGRGALAGGVVGAADPCSGATAVPAYVAPIPVAPAVVPPPPTAPAPATAAPTYEDLVRLSQTKVPDSEIIDQIRTSGAVYHPNADQLLYLNQNGVHEAVIREVQATAYRPARAIPAGWSAPPAGYASPGQPQP